MNAISGAQSVEQAALQTKIATSLMAKQLDSAKQQGHVLVQLIEAAGNIGRHPGLGQKFDTQA